jgi:hypothetical protein
MLKLKPIKITFSILLVSLTSLFKINAQTFDFNLQSSSLTFDYSTLNNFQTSRTTTKAFTLNVTNSKKGQYNVYCKLEPINNFNIGLTPTSLFSIKLNSANFTISGSSFLTKPLGLSDLLLLEVNGRSKKSDVIYFDLILNPLEFIYEPNYYNYNFIFTLTEL